jgi:2-dehydropantoate 2-reductase
LREQLLDRGYRRLVAACLEEGLNALSRKGISPRSELPAPLRLLPWVLRLPSPLFRRIERYILRIDAEARSSMWDDLQRGRLTEVDLINGEIVWLAESVGAEARVNRAIIAELRAAEASGHGSPRLPATALLEKAGLQEAGC